MAKTETAGGRGSVQDSVYGALRKSILNLNLAPGTAISEKEISLRYGVSRTPVRETFIHLSKEGLLKVIPQRETLVTRIDFERIKQEFFLRESLEMAILEPFAALCRPKHFEDIARFIEMQESAAAAKEYVRFIEYDDSLHRTFFEAAGQEICWTVLNSMSGHYHRARLLSIWLNDIARNVVGQHKKLVRALAKKDIPAARCILSGHLHKISSEEPLMREKYPDYFVSDEENTFDVDFGGLQLSSAR
ncbi:MAG: GntR family transcriptional regulator [Spirochaetales bacterium]|nr:GntR family transcriptional regulator [Spirochaetales bacterium]